MNKVILIQGPITHPEEIKNTYKGLDVIVSTFSDDGRLVDSGFTVVINEKPIESGYHNFNYQVLNTLNGIKKAEEMGYDYVLKIRSDITIPRINDLLELMGTPVDKLFFSAYHHWDGGYLCEHMVYGETKLMKRLWDIPLSELQLPPEIQLTNHFLSNLKGVDVDYIFPLLYANSILAYWEKRFFYLNDYKQDKLFTYDEYTKKE